MVQRARQLGNDHLIVMEGTSLANREDWGSRIDSLLSFNFLACARHEV